MRAENRKLRRDGGTGRHADLNQVARRGDDQVSAPRGLGEDLTRKERNRDVEDAPRHPCGQTPAREGAGSGRTTKERERGNQRSRYLSLSVLFSHSAASGGGSFLSVMTGQP